MSIITHEQIIHMAERRDTTCVSIYLPVEYSLQDWQHDRLLLKGLLKDVERQLSDREIRPREIAALIEPAERLMGDGRFWSHLSDGLAVFLAPGEFLTISAPIKFPKTVVTGYRYYLKPLMPLLTGDGQFYILALSQKRVRLFQCSRDSIEEIELQDMPLNIEEALQFDDPEKQIQFHTSTASPGSGTRQAVFHGHGDLSDVLKNNLLRYFRKVNEGLLNILGDQSAPMILAAVDYLHPIYQKANNYRDLLAEGIEGNPDEVNPEILHQRAWQIVQPLFEQERRDKLESFQRAMDTDLGKCAITIENVLISADQGRVDTLFLVKDAQQWGQFDPTVGHVEFDSKPDINSRDLLDLAAVRTLRYGGKVYLLEANEMPAPGLAAALLRY